jgi:hypothetical protein
MHVVVDPNDLVLRNICKVLHSASLASTCWALKNDGIVTHGNHTCQLLKKAFERLGGHEILFVEAMIWVNSLGYDKLLHLDVPI